MKEEKISRKQFLSFLGVTATAIVVSRVAGVASILEPKKVAVKSQNNSYGNFPYGGIKT